MNGVPRVTKTGLAFALVLISGIAFAGPTRYVTSDLQIDMRSGPTTQHRILKFLDAGEAVESLEANTDGWTLIRTRGGEEGWVLTRYLQNGPGYKEQLERATASVDRLQQDVQQLRKTVGEERQRANTAEARGAELSTANEQMKQQLAEAGRGLALSQENKDLKQRLVDAQREIQDLKTEVNRLGDRSQRDWFVTGAAVVFAGFIVGIVVTRIRWQRKSSWGNL